MDEREVERRNIHTYPFKYTHTPANQFFAPERAAMYVHIPFCRRKCHFCDYLIYTGTSAELRQSYVDAACTEIQRFPTIPCYPPFEIDALYFGGGTPGLLETRQLLQILSTCRKHFSFTEDAEICIEFDPHCATREKLEALREAGFNRLSLGVQTFDAELLRANNRPHDASAIHHGFDAVRSAGFTHVNIDILYPMFDQTMEHWEGTIREALQLEPATITAYPLEIWPHTRYHEGVSQGRPIAAWDVEEAMSRQVYDRLEGAGFQRNCTCGYFHPERTGHYCRFGDYYWRTWPMIGIGVSAKTVIHDRLYTNIRDVNQYIQRLDAGKDVVDFSTRMTREQEMRRVMIRGLKLCRVAKQEFRDRFGVPMETVFADEIQGLVAMGWIEDKEDAVELTREGQVYDRSVYAAFYTEEDLRPPREGEVQYGLSDPLSG